VVSYDGTDFAGWQFQKEARSVQGVIEEALARMHGHPVFANGAGRTDSGVHASGQVFNFRTHIAGMEARNFTPALNRLLPRDVRIHSAVQVPDDFDARRSALMREYRYHIYPDRVVPPHLRRYCWGIHKRLDPGLLNRMAVRLVGTHDFTSFAALRDPNDSKFRDVYSAAFFPEGPFLVFRIVGSSFMWRMVRNLVGTLLTLAGDGESPEKVSEILEARDSYRSEMTAPARGLFLHKVLYGEEVERGVY